VLVLHAAARDLEDRRGNPLGSLWLKGARLVQHPDIAAANVAATGLATGKRNDYTAAALSAVGREPGSRESALVP
jgi:hypothetical protein